MKITYLNRNPFFFKILLKIDTLLSKKLIKVTLVTLNKNDNISKMKVILSDSSKFQKLSIDQNKVLNHIVHFFFFFLIGIHSMQGSTAITRHGVTRKEAQ